MDATQFKTDFPAFAGASEARVAFWLRVATKQLPEDRWGDLYPEGLGLYVAHNLAVEGRAIGGSVVGQVTGKTVDKISVSYDTAAVSMTDAGHWNASVYGIQLLQLARMVGAGGMQI